MRTQKYWKSQRFQRDLINRIKNNRYMVERRSLIADATDHLIQNITGEEYATAVDQTKELQKRIENQDKTEGQMHIELDDGIVAKVEISDLSFVQREIEGQKSLEEQLDKETK